MLTGRERERRRNGSPVVSSSTAEDGFKTKLSRKGDKGKMKQDETRVEVVRVPTNEDQPVGDVKVESTRAIHFGNSTATPDTRGAGDDRAPATPTIHRARHMQQLRTAPAPAPSMARNAPPVQTPATVQLPQQAKTRDADGSNDEKVEADEMEGEITCPM